MENVKDERLWFPLDRTTTYTDDLRSPVCLSARDCVSHLYVLLCISAHFQSGLELCSRTSMHKETYSDNYSYCQEQDEHTSVYRNVRTSPLTSTDAFDNCPQTDLDTIGPN